MKYPLLLLQEILPDLNSSQHILARFLLDHPDLVVSESIQELAKKTFTSPSSIVRLCQRCGFSGFKQFKVALLHELALRMENRSISNTEIRPDEPLESLVEKVTYRNIQALEESKNLLDMAELTQAAQLIDHARVIHLFGLGASFCAAKDAYLKFLRLNRLCILNEDWHSQWVQARNSSSEDLAIVFSYSGETKEILRCMEALKKNGTAILAITRALPSPVSKMATCKLFISSQEATFRSGAMSSRLSQLNLIDILHSVYLQKHAESCLEQLNRTHIEKHWVL